MEDETPVKDSVPTKPEETKPAPDVPPAVTPPADANADLRSAVTALSAKVEELSGIVTGVIASGGAHKDSTPVRKPWTHKSFGKGRD